jgi:hypothetical protein
VLPQILRARLAKQILTGDLWHFHFTPVYIQVLSRNCGLISSAKSG